MTNLDKATRNFVKAERAWNVATTKARRMVDKAEKDYQKALAKFKQAQVDHLYEVKR